MSYNLNERDDLLGKNSSRKRVSDECSALKKQEHIDEQVSVVDCFILRGDCL